MTSQRRIALRRNALRGIALAGFLVAAAARMTAFAAEDTDNADSSPSELPASVLGQHDEAPVTATPAPALPRSTRPAVVLIHPPEKLAEQGAADLDGPRISHGVVILSPATACGICLRPASPSLLKQRIQSACGEDAQVLQVQPHCQVLIRICAGAGCDPKALTRRLLAMPELQHCQPKVQIRDP